MKKFLFFVVVALLIFAPQVLVCMAVLAVVLCAAFVSFALLYIAVTESPSGNSSDDD